MTILWVTLVSVAEHLVLSVITGLIAGSYPAFYLSSFQPARVLKGSLRVGRSAAIPRKLLVAINSQSPPY